MHALLNGMLIGFMIAAPVGPIDILCIRRTLLWGTLAGFLTGLGAAFADAIYGAIAAYSMGSLQAAFIQYKSVIQILGGIFLISLGIKTFIKDSQFDYEKPTNDNVKAAITTFFLALLSPATLISFIGAFAVLEIGFESQIFKDQEFLTAGVFLGSTLWWFILSFIIGFFRTKFSPLFLKYINRVSGVMLIVFGLVAFFI